MLQSASSLPPAGLHGEHGAGQAPGGGQVAQELDWRGGRGAPKGGQGAQGGGQGAQGRGQVPQELDWSRRGDQEEEIWPWTLTSSVTSYV